MATNLNYEYGMELTWVGKYPRLAKQAGKLQEAFPLVVEEPEPEPEEQQEEGISHAEQASPDEINEATHAILGLKVDQLVTRFINAGFTEDYAKREASRLAKDIVYFKMGLIDSIDPYAGTRENSIRSIRVRRQVSETIVAQSRTSTRTRRTEVDVVDTNQLLRDEMGTHIVNSLLAQWQPVGYRDRNGLCGVQWNESNNEIELTSPCHRTLEQAEVFYKAAYHGFTTVFGLPIETEQDSGGGGHLHVTKKDGTGAFERDHMFNMCWELCARPYIGWAFNDPNDMTEGPAPIAEISSLMNGSPDYNFRKASGIRWASPSHRAQIPGDDGRRRDYTVEFRIFQMARNWEEQKAHILFIDKWAKAAEHRDYTEKLPPLPVWKGGRARGWTDDKAMGEMQRFITSLGLNYEDYREIIERNIVTKFTHYSSELT